MILLIMAAGIGGEAAHNMQQNPNQSFKDSLIFSRIMKRYASNATGNGKYDISDPADATPSPKDGDKKKGDGPFASYKGILGKVSSLNGKQKSLTDRLLGNNTPAPSDSGKGKAVPGRLEMSHLQTATAPVDSNSMSTDEWNAQFHRSSKK